MTFVVERPIRNRFGVEIRTVKISSDSSSASAVVWIGTNALRLPLRIRTF